MEGPDCGAIFQFRRYVHLVTFIWVVSVLFVVLRQHHLIKFPDFCQPEVFKKEQMQMTSM